MEIAFLKLRPNIKKKKLREMKKYIETIKQGLKKRCGYGIHYFFETKWRNYLI
jgi:hypothetical protein